MYFTFENYKYFPNICLPYIGKKYWDSVFKGNVQLVLSIVFTSFPQHVWIATDSLAISTAAEDFFNSYPNTNWKWNCKGESLQIFSSEIILAWENGSQVHHFGKFLISKFLKGLAHSALVSYVVFSSNWLVEEFRHSCDIGLVSLLIDVLGDKAPALLDSDYRFDIDIWSKKFK